MEKERRQQARVNVKWPVTVEHSDGHLEGETLNFTINSAFIRCSRPLRLNEIFDMIIDAPDRRLSVNAEVVWSNSYGYDDKITPRGMGVRFLGISSEDRDFIAEVLDSNKLSRLASEYIKTLEKELDILIEEETDLSS